VQTGALNKKEFRDVMKHLNFGDALLQDLIFNVFDRNRDGVISFREFVNGLSVMTRGTPDEKLECSCALLCLVITLNNTILLQLRLRCTT